MNRAGGCSTCGGREKSSRGIKTEKRAAGKRWKLYARAVYPVPGSTRFVNYNAARNKHSRDKVRISGTTLSGISETCVTSMFFLLARVRKTAHARGISHLVTRRVGTRNCE